MPATAMPVYADSSDDEDYYNEDGRCSPPDSPSGSRFAASPLGSDSGAGSSSSATPPRFGEGGAANGSGGGAKTHGGGDAADDEDEFAVAGSLTPSILKLLHVPKPGANFANAPTEVDELSAELHDNMSQRGTPSAARSLLTALSKESLDIMRAERIARRMAQQQQAPAAAVLGAVRAVGFEEGQPAMNVSLALPLNEKKPRKLKSNRKEERVYMPILATKAGPPAAAFRVSTTTAPPPAAAPNGLETLYEA